MIEEVLKRVSSSEETAQKIKEESEAKAALIRSAAEKGAAEEKENGALEARVKRIESVRRAKSAAAEHFESERKVYLAEAENFKTEKSGKAEEIAEELFGRVKNGDC